MADISSFKGKMIHGGARNNQFSVEMSFPTFAGGNTLAESVRFLAKSATLPSSNLADSMVMYRGRPVHMAGEREFEPWTIEIYNDNDFTIRHAFETWVNEIQNADSSSGLLAPSAYQVQMQVFQLDRNDSILKEYTFVDAWPINVGAIQLSWDANNEIEVFPVTFQYNYWLTKAPSLPSSL